ncbi:hypothetical protein [Lederbergia citrea]|uniref:hypothetical protein n=1 Tax=Lederbergia citrea TaxID=2833581 RepID=UPI001BC9FFA9|nr:hypothetical protein [Lederbergia citrea]MBS4178785.1 hypothetical protein [Lederbergia citrea]
MLNYGEELAYWYLRFNGFFVLDNFVYHQTLENRNGDADLLAIRLPNVEEPIGGSFEDWDEKLFTYIGGYDVLGVLCEVKTGVRPDLSKAFEYPKVRYALNRIGFSKYEVDEMLEGNEHFILQCNQKKFIKLVISEHPIRSNNTFLSFSLKDIEKFIYKRINDYTWQKYNARHFFSSSLIQYMMYKKE